MKLSICLIALFFTQTLWAQPKDFCDSVILQERTVSYCISTTDRQKNPDVVFQFHGLFGNAAVWQIMGVFKKVRKQWRSTGYTPPTVVALSLGPYWLLTDVPSRGAKLDFFHDTVLPYFEQMIGGLGAGRRSLLGESMGGYNALQMALKFPDDFEKVAVLSPALPTLPFGATHDDCREYAARTGANYLQALFVAEMIGHEFRTRQEFENQNPFRRLIENQKLLPKFYISAGDKDGYGFFEGSKLFCELANSQGHPCEFVPIKNGNHRSFEANSLSLFFSKEPRLIGASH
jgi:pimeloyl-ACP methyl ester carboxylesterase